MSIVHYCYQQMIRYSRVRATFKLFLIFNAKGFQTAIVSFLSSDLSFLSLVSVFGINQQHFVKSRLVVYNREKHVISISIRYI